MITKIKYKLYWLFSIVLTVTTITTSYYIHNNLKGKPYDEIYLTAMFNARFDNYPKLPKFIYKVYVNNFRGNKQDLLSLYPDPITWFIGLDSDIQTKKLYIDNVLNKGISINIVSKDYSKMTPIFSAIIFNQEDILYYLVDKGASLDAKDDKGNTPLELAKMLLEKSKQINDKSMLTDKEKKEFIEYNKNKQEILIRMIKYMEKQNINKKG
jgi:hypothetical protein